VRLTGGVRLTHRWREMDSNWCYRGTAPPFPPPASVPMRREFPRGWKGGGIFRCRGCAAAASCRTGRALPSARRDLPNPGSPAESQRTFSSWTAHRRRQLRQRRLHMAPITVAQMGPRPCAETARTPSIFPPIKGRCRATGPASRREATRRSGDSVMYPEPHSG